MIVTVDFSTIRPSHVKAAQKALATLPVGERYVHDHGMYRTPISVWVAQLRNRLGRGLRYERAGKHSTRYYIYPTTGGHN